MMTQWQEFLASQDAVFNQNEVSDFGNRKAELQAAANGDILVDLSHLGLIQIEGEDAINFLQGQVTNDVKQLNGNNSHYSGYCNPKGRLLAIFLAFAHYDHLHLQLHGALTEAIIKRLRMYVMRSKVVITDVSDSIIRLGYAGKDSTATLTQLFGSVPQQPYALISLDSATLLRLPGTTPRYEIFTTLEHVSDIWKQLTENSVKAGKSCWDWLEIQAGIPDIAPATQEAFVPQMINLDALDGINFKKGCYTGQEIVARTHYLGKVKRRTQLAHIEAVTMPQAGDALHGHDGNEAGQIVRVAPHPENGFDVLAEIRLDSLEAGNVNWQGNVLAIQALPYRLA